MPEPPPKVRTAILSTKHQFFIKVICDCGHMMETVGDDESPVATAIVCRNQECRFRDQVLELEIGLRFMIDRIQVERQGQRTEKPN